MVFTVELTPEEEQRVEKARQMGINVDAMLHAVIAALPPVETVPVVKARDLFARWEEEARARTPEEVAEEDAREEEFFRNLKESQGEVLLRTPEFGQDD